MFSSPSRRHRRRGRRHCPFRVGYRSRSTEADKQVLVIRRAPHDVGGRAVVLTLVDDRIGLWVDDQPVVGLAVGWCACGEVELLFVGVGDGPTVGAELFFRVDELNRTGRFVFDFGLLAFRLLTVGSVVGWPLCWPFVAATGTAREGDTCDDCACRQEASTGRLVRHTFCEDKLCKSDRSITC